MTRREFVRMGSASGIVLAASWQVFGPAAVLEAAPPPPPPPEEQPQIIDAGPVEDYPADGVYSFRDDGFFIIRRNGRLWAMSAVCTHRGCIVRARPDRSFHCRCHRSSFDADGRVVGGPAPRDLPRLAVATDQRNHVLVHPGRPLRPAASGG